MRSGRPFVLTARFIGLLVVSRNAAIESCYAQLVQYGLVLRFAEGRLIPSKDRFCVVCPFLARLAHEFEGPFVLGTWVSVAYLPPRTHVFSVVYLVYKTVAKKRLLRGEGWIYAISPLNV